ncbi:MAG: hypothetical protein IJ437_05470 [Clostridia bacterium]|nr:hypothetical protein [Clostridia bacterium]
MIKPEKQFYIFGMGNREKFIYKEGGSLIKFATNEVVYTWDVKREKFLFDRYMVVIWTSDEKTFLISEDSFGAYIYDITDGEKKLLSTLCKSEYINLPDFEDYEYPEQLRILHQEILVSFNGNNPVPNIYTYKKPWYRDSAMMALVLEKTKNLHLIKPWALGVKNLYDKNNKGNCEPDNLGQLAFVLSFFVDKNYPLIAEIYNEAERIADGGLLRGMTDYGVHEIYSTLWLRLAFDRLGIRADFIKIPHEFDSYARMFWMDKKGVETKTPFDNEYNEWYPYLSWAVYHFNGDEIPKELLKIQYPMSWEICASEADYNAIAPLSEEYAKNKCSAPHSWHAAEMFMYLIEKK